MQGFPFDSQLTFDDDNLPVYDRAVSSQPLRELIRDLFTTGVMPNPSTNLQVSSGTDGMTVQVQAGFAVVDGGLCQETETRTLEVTAADTTYDRIDTVVLRWNENVDARTADLYVVAGTPSATPVRPALQRDNSIYEIGLADIFITKRVATITDDKITDTRYESERCGIVSSVSEWDTTTIYQQIQADLAGFKANEEADFETWFDYMKDQLSEDAAGHLQEEIDELKEVEYTSSDTELEPTTSETVALLTSGETAPSRWAKVSQMFKNIRYLFGRVDELNNDLSELLVVGSITAYAGSTAPNGYLICDGSAISRTDYAKLFAVIGTTYGSGDGSTTFNIPDCREVALVGIGQNATHSIANHDTYTLGQFKDDQMQNHLHGLSFEYKGEGGSGGTNMQYSTYANTTGYVKNARNGNVTRGKRLGMNYIIKY